AIVVETPTNIVNATFAIRQNNRSYLTTTRVCSGRGGFLLLVLLCLLRGFLLGSFLCLGGCGCLFCLLLCHSEYSLVFALNNSYVLTTKLHYLNIINLYKREINGYRWSFLRGCH